MAILYATAGAGESLWVDELHSSWTVSGGLSQIGPRAAAGNQSPLYFWLLWGLNQLLSWTPGTREIVFRLISILSWGLTVWLAAHWIAQEARRRSAQPAWVRVAPVVIAGWIVLDRIQLFYATEARVYELLQLVSLLNWLVVVRLVYRPATADDTPPVRLGARQLQLVWCVLSAVLINLHITAALAVAWQWLVVAAWTAASLRTADRQGYLLARARLQVWLISAVSVAVLSVPAALWSRGVWERRAQWESFAGDASLWNAINLFPLLAFVVPVAVGRILDRWLTSRQGNAESAHGLARGESPSRDLSWLWLVAAAGPWLTAWAVTALDLAPVFHRRFVIVSGLPLVLLAATQWLQIRSSSLRWLSGMGVVLWLVIGQGSLDVWRQGYVVGWQRGEDWRGATEWLQPQLEPGHQVWSASGLIEGKGMRPPISDELNRYLSFPLRGIYRLQDAAGQPLEPQALVSDPDLWLQQWQTDRHPRAAPATHWIVYRGQAERLQKHLQRHVEQAAGRVLIAEQAKSFGRVSVAAIRLER